MIRNGFFVFFTCVFLCVVACDSSLDLSSDKFQGHETNPNTTSNGGNLSPTDMSDQVVAGANGESSSSTIEKEDIGNQTVEAIPFVNPLSKEFVDQQIASMNSTVEHRWWRNKIENDELLSLDDRRNMLYLYDKIVENATNVLTDQTCEITLPIGETLSFLRLRDAYDAVIFDYPQLFWLGVGYNGSFLSSDTNKYDKIIIKSVGLAQNDEEALAILKDVDAKADMFISKLDLNGSSVDILKEIFNGLRSIGFSNLVLSSSVKDWEIHCIYGAFILNNCVCDGYASTYSYIVKKLQAEKKVLSDVFCTMVYGKPRGMGSGGTYTHAWNLVYMVDEGKWYETDATAGLYFQVPGDTKCTDFIRGHRLDSSHMSSRYVPTAKIRLERFWENPPMGWVRPSVK